MLGLEVKEVAMVLGRGKVVEEDRVEEDKVEEDRVEDKVGDRGRALRGGGDQGSQT